MLCKSILEIDPLVRFAGVCDHTGEIKHGGHAEGYGKYSMTEYEKIKRITIPLKGEHLLLVTTEIRADHVKIIRAILDLV